MLSYSVPITVDVHDVDYNGVCRASSLMRYIQSAAQLQLDEHGLSYDELYQKQHRAFLLSRITMEFYEAPREGARLTAETFPVPSRGFTFLRCYQLWHGDTVIGRAISAWALIDTDNRHLVQTKDFELPLPHLEPLELELARIHMPSELCAVGEYTVSYADTDQNRHMNNTRYPDMYASFLPMEGHRIASITISYRKEAPMGTRLGVYHAYADGAHYLRTVLPDGEINSEGRIVLCDIQ